MNDPPSLSISSEQLCFIVLKAREIDVKAAISDPDSGSNATDDRMIDVHEDHGDDPSFEELTAFIDALDMDRQIDLVALSWLGRGNAERADWDMLRAEAERDHK